MTSEKIARGKTASARRSVFAPSAAEVERRARHTIVALLGTPTLQPNIQLVARIVGTSVRTLQRRLHTAGASYAAVVQDARCTAARRLLRDRGRRVGDVARLLGYSDPAHFTRAFQHWTGMTPRDFRRRG